MKVKIYLEQGATMPQRAHDDDFGWDVKATSKHDDTPLKGCVTYGTGIHLAFPSQFSVLSPTIPKADPSMTEN